MGRFLAAMVASTCSSEMRPCSTICIISLRKVGSSSGPRRKLRSALAKTAVFAVNSVRISLPFASSGYIKFAWRATLRQLLIMPPQRVRASFQRAYPVLVRNTRRSESAGMAMVKGCAGIDARGWYVPGGKMKFDSW